MYARELPGGPVVQVVVETADEAGAGTAADRVYVALRGEGCRTREHGLARVDFLTGHERFERGAVRGVGCVKRCNV